MHATDSTEVNPQTPSIESSRPLPPVQCFIIRLASGAYLLDFVGDGVSETSVPERARVFFSKRGAERVLHGSVVPAPAPVQPRHPFPMPPQPPTKPQPDETGVQLLARLIIESSEVANYAGVQKGFCIRGVKHPPLVLFTSHKSGSTLALPILQISRRSVSEAVAKSDREFETFSETAATRVLTQFAEVGA